MEMKNKPEEEIVLTENDLVKVTGGDYGDNEKELVNGELRCLYAVGDTVEIYRTIFHVSTRRGVIFELEERVNNEGKPYVRYHIRCDDGTTIWMRADDIES